MHKNNNELYGNIALEYFVIASEDCVDLSVTHLCGGETKQPVILLHGSYSNRHLWISPKGKGLASYLFEHGYDIWIPEFRGHGKSPKGDKFKQFTAEQQIRNDIPVFGKFVLEQTGKTPDWVGHSIGGLFLYGALSRRCKGVNQTGEGWATPRCISRNKNTKTPRSSQNDGTQHDRRN